MAGLIKDRTTITLILAVLLSLTVGSLRLDKPRGMSPKTFWAEKLEWKECADAVFLGDSRVLMGTAPEVLQAYLDYENILNFAFGANWYCREYMDAAEELLDPQAENKTLIMGISPNALTWRTKGLGLFIELKETPEKERFFNRHFGPIYDFFDPMSFKDVLQGLLPSTAPTRTTKYYKENGWCAVHKIGDDENNEVKRYRAFYKNRQVSDKTVDTVMQYVSRWSKQGIKVYGFIPPTCPNMVELEDTASGFDKESFVKKFTEAGGIWLDVNLTDYYSFDGSHLQDDDAIRFSNDLGKMIKEVEKKSQIVRTK